MVLKCVRFRRERRVAELTRGAVAKKGQAKIEDSWREKSVFSFLRQIVPISLIVFCYRAALGNVRIVCIWAVRSL